MDEAAWIEAAKAGDVQAFNLLVVAHQQVAYELAFRMLRDEHAAADATQDSFLAAFTHLRQFRGGSFRAWLLRIVLNHVYDQIRALRRHPTESLDPLTDDEDAPVLQIADRGPTPEQVLLSREIVACIESGLQTLSPEQRATVILCDVQGMSYEEAAAATGANLGTVKSRLNRGRLALRAYLSRHAELLPASLRHHFEGHEDASRSASPLATDG
ncbi:MAG: sigma-70 family RNA polymerase sigma factor [Sphingomonadaceae bacterium]